MSIQHFDLYDNSHMNDAADSVNELTQRISQILDDAKELTYVNMGSKAGRQMVATVIAKKLRGQ